MSTTTTDPTALTIDGAAATLAALPDSPDVRTAAAMLAAAPTTPVGTLRKWMTAHDGETVDTLQFRTWCGHDTLAAWAPTDRTIDASRAGSVRFNGSTLDYRGVRVIGADDVSIVTLSDEFLTVYRLSSARPAPGAAEGDTTTPATVPPTVTARLCIHCDEPVPAPTSASGMTRCGHCGTLMSPDRLYDDGERIDAFELHPYFACDNCEGGGPACGEVSHRGTDASGAVWQRCDDCGPPTEDAAPTAPTDPRPTTTVMNDQGVTFHARLIRTGDRYGLVDKLTNDGAAMVEFFDAEADPAKFGPLGQFVSRYYVDTFNETAEDGRGIALEGSVPRWTITAAEVAAWPVFVTFTDEEGDPGSVIGPFEDRTAAEQWIAELPREVANFHSAMSTRLAWPPAQREGCGERLTDPPPAAAPPVIATRVTMHEAKRHFEAGGAVLVSEYGHEPTQTVHPNSTHDRTRTTWDALAADVKEWRNRYPNQRFYIVPNAETVAEHEPPDCNECGALDTSGYSSAVNPAHDESCSLHPSNAHGCTCSTDDACPDHPGDPCPACGRRSGHDDGCTDDETERDDIDVDTLDGTRCAAAMLASVVAAVRAEVAVRSAEFEEQHYGNADESLEAARCAGNLNALRWLESLVTAPIR